MQKLLTRKEISFATVAAMQASVELQDGDIVTTETFDSTISNGGGAFYSVSLTPLTPNNRTTFALQNGLYATLYHNGSASVQQANVDIGDDVSLGLAMPALKSAGVKNVYIPNKRVTFNGNFNLDGMNLFGNDSVYATGTFTGGNMYGITRESLTTQFLENEQTIQPVLTKSNPKILVKAPSTPYGDTSPNGELYAVISPSSYGGVAAFFMSNGTGTNEAGNLGTPFDRMRVVNGFLYDNGVICKLHDSTTGTVATTSFDYFDKKYNRTINDAVRWSPTAGVVLNAINMSAGATATYTIPAAKSRSNIAVYTSATSSTSVDITVNGQTVKNFSARDVDNKVKIVEFDTPVLTNGTNEIVVSTAGTLYLFGADVYDITNLKNNDIEDLYKYSHKLILTDQKQITYTGTGASIDSVIVDSNGDFGGSFHGGDLADNGKCKFEFGRNEIVCDTTNYTETNPTLKLTDGQFIVSKTITATYEGNIAGADVIKYRHAMDFGIDGGVNYTAWYTADIADVNLRTLYTGMHSTSRNLLSTPVRTFPSTATESTVELTNNEFPLVQYGNNNQQVLIMPSKTSEKHNSILGHVWDNTNYVKLYYTPIKNTGTNVTTLKQGKTFSFSCLYQYGNNIL